MRLRSASRTASNRKSAVALQRGSRLAACAFLRDDSLLRTSHLASALGRVRWPTSRGLRACLLRTVGERGLAGRCSSEQQRAALPTSSDHRKPSGRSLCESTAVGVREPFQIMLGLRPAPRTRSRGYLLARRRSLLLRSARQRACSIVCVLLWRQSQPSQSATPAQRGTAPLGLNGLSRACTPTSIDVAKQRRASTKAPADRARAEARAGRSRVQQCVLT